MKKSELFALTTGLIGLAADLITLLQFSWLRSSGAPASTLNSSISLEVITIFTLIYSWFIISWMLVRRHWVKTQLGKELILTEYSSDLPLPKHIFSNRTASTVGAVGVIAFSLSMLLPVNHRLAGLNWFMWFVAIFGANAFCIIALGFLIHLVITSLMPIIYTDMEDLAD